MTDWRRTVADGATRLGYADWAGGKRTLHQAALANLEDVATGG